MRKRSGRTSRWVFASSLFGLLLLAGSAVAQESPPKESPFRVPEYEYIGLRLCRTCHSKQELGGEEYAIWARSPHANAFNTLGGAAAKEIAAGLGIRNPQEAPECLECHTTGHGVDDVWKGDELTLTEGVSCEACHGPGDGYKGKATMLDHEASLAKGLVIPDETTCRACHNERSPTYKGFEYAKYLSMIRHWPLEEMEETVEYHAEPAKGVDVGLFVATALLPLTLVLVWVVRARPLWLLSKGGLAVSTVAMVGLPAFVTTVGMTEHMKHATSTRFCLSCHEMGPYGDSLLMDDPQSIVAAHYQNNLIPRDKACYTCHTSYAMFGGFRAKMRGLKHLLVHFTGPPAPGEFALYTPYHNRECLHCHAGSKRFETLDVHRDYRQALASNETSCLECHETTHHSQEDDQ